MGKKCSCNDQCTFDNIAPRKTSMTFWSKSDPVWKFSGKVDHWTKLRRRAEEQANILSEGTSTEFDCYLSKCFNDNPPGEYYMGKSVTLSGKNTYLSSSYNKRAKKGFVYWTNPKSYNLSNSSFVPRDCSGKNEISLEDEKRCVGESPRLCFGSK